ncbi:MAG: hypothetical protein NC218_10750 [Acetobacter sp.]|nr:hypothetical protein [Acetobacter sp.]
MDKLGKILFPEQYAPVGNEVRVSNSIEALAFFEDYYPKGGMVLLGNIRFDYPQMPNMMVWMYFDISSEEPKIISTIPVFDVPIEALNNRKILEITPHQNEVFSLWKDVLYCSVYTDTGEICIMKVRSLLNAEEAASVYEMQTGMEVEDIYPVELYSHSAHKFVGVCWAVTLIGDDNRIFWYPVCLEEENAIAAYSADDLTDHFIDKGETAVIGGDTYRLTIDENGYIFKKIRSKEELQQLFSERMKNRARQMCRAKDVPSGKKCVFLPFSPKGLVKE